MGENWTVAMMNGRPVAAFSTPKMAERWAYGVSGVSLIPAKCVPADKLADQPQPAAPPVEVFQPPHYGGLLGPVPGVQLPDAGPAEAGADADPFGLPADDHAARVGAFARGDTESDAGELRETGAEYVPGSRAGWFLAGRFIGPDAASALAELNALTAIRKFRATAGRNWKSRLRRAWENGCAGVSDPAERAALMAARNKLGPTYLEKMKL